MEGLNLIPMPDTIPAHWGIFEFLDIFTFIIHILFVNVVVGGSILMLYSHLKGEKPEPGTTLHGPIVNKIPSALALAINFGVAPLLFVQVIYGNLIYSSSILMAWYWILVIPLLIIAYYGVYIHARKTDVSKNLAVAALTVSVLIFLYIMFVYVNNMTLMLHPEKWSAYFQNRAGTILNTGNPTLFPRFLHFIFASIAVAALFSSIVWYFRRKNNADSADKKIKTGLKIFAVATSVQVIIGLWFVIALPKNIMLALMGENLLYTLIFLAGICAGIAVIITAFTGKLSHTVILLVLTVVFMIINRANLRSLYLEEYFKPDTLQLSPQYGIFILFLIVFVIGLITVGYMLKTAFKESEGRAK